MTLWTTEPEAKAQAWRYINGWLIGLALGLGYCWGAGC